MSGDVVPILGSFILVFTLLILIETLVIRPYILGKIWRAEGVAKVLIATHGTKSWNQIEREFTRNYKAGLRQDAVLNLLASAYDTDTIEDLEKKNPYAGSYNPKSEYQNSDNLKRYLDAHAAPETNNTQRADFLDKQSTALALSIVLNLIRTGELRREVTKDVK
jgi:hypothetical protein